jgi:sulfite oxidase
MRTKEKEVWGIDWRNGAVMNASWTGVLLSDVLALAKPTLHPNEESHVAFSCYQTATQDDGYYGGSIPLKRAQDSDMEVLLALKMNGKDLTPERGFPVRVIVPGVAGARAVKWLDRITVQKQESSNAYQQRDYKILPPEVVNKEQAAGYWHKLPAILEMPVNSVIVTPESEAEIPDPTIEPLVIEGYALPQGSEGPVVKVEISADKGKTWEQADIVTEATRWSWVLWKYMHKGQVDQSTVFWSKATDKAGNTQVEGGQWNLRGVAYNAFGEISGLKVR